MPETLTSRPRSSPWGISSPRGRDPLSSLGSFTKAHISIVGEPAPIPHTQDHSRRSACKPRCTCLSKSAPSPRCFSGQDMLSPRRAPVCFPLAPMGRGVGSRGWGRGGKDQLCLLQTPLAACLEPGASKPWQGASMHPGKCTRTETYMYLMISHTFLPSIPLTQQPKGC